jgi:protein-disulfide isomerase
MRADPARQIAGGVLVLVLAVATGLGAKKVRKPQPERADPARTRGEAGAPVTIVEYSDFECPACRVAEPPLRQIMELYKGKVRLIFKHFPLEMMHHTARFAAQSAQCASKQGKFWELHDLLYDKQPDWAQAQDPRAALLKLAATVKLDPKELEACSSAKETNAAIDADVQDGNDRFVYSTPTFFIDGKRFVGARQLQQLAPGWIDRRLGGK